MYNIIDDTVEEGFSMIDSIPFYQAIM